MIERMHAQMAGKITSMLLENAADADALQTKVEVAVADKL